MKWNKKENEGHILVWNGDGLVVFVYDGGMICHNGSVHDNLRDGLGWGEPCVWKQHGTVDDAVAWLSHPDSSEAEYDKDMVFPMCSSDVCKSFEVAMMVMDGTVDFDYYNNYLAWKEVGV
jgi:hypothetical protein